MHARVEQCILVFLLPSQDSIGISRVVPSDAQGREMYTQSYYDKDLILKV